MSRTYEFVQLDVFTQTPLTGNPLAIFTDGRGLSDQQMQALAREMNLSETTFILPKDRAAEAHKVRIFTVSEELPFAGHPTLGTALYLYASESAPNGDSTGRRDSSSERNVCASNARRPTYHERSCWRICRGSAARDGKSLISVTVCCMLSKGSLLGEFERGRI